MKLGDRNPVLQMLPIGKGAAFREPRIIAQFHCEKFKALAGRIVDGSGAAVLGIDDLHLRLVEPAIEMQFV